MSTNHIAANPTASKNRSPKKVHSLPENIDSIIRPDAMARLTGKSLTTLWRDEKAGRFPKRIKIGVQATGWLRSQYEHWLSCRRAS